MKRHLNDKELSGYIHQTLTDAQRESMNLHLDTCSRCRERVDGAKTMQRRIHYGISAELRQVHPTNMRFNQIAPKLHKRRRWATIRFYSMQTLSTVAVLAVIVMISTVIISFMQSSAEWMVTAPVAAASTVLDEEWDDAIVYRQGLILSERSAMQQLDEAPVYHMALTLPDGLDAVYGEQEVRYTNRTEQSLKEVYFLLTPNLTNNQITVSEVKVNGIGVAAQPVEENKPSLLRVPLPEVLQPNQQVVIYMAFVLEMVLTRTDLNGTLGIIDDVLTLSSFHPALAIYEDGNWQLDPPIHGVAPVPENSFYLVEVTTSNGLPVIASGLEVGREMVGERQVITYAAGPIGQFYLTASEKYTVALSQMVGDTKVTSYAYAEHLTGQARTALDYAVAALENLNIRYGKYPFTRLDVIGTPTLGVVRPGMVYPGVILTDLNQYETVYTFGERSLESAVIFGVAQQWFGRTLGSNRLKTPWLSESVSEFVTQSILIDLYGRELATKQRVNYLGLHDRRYTVPIGLPTRSYTLGDYLATMYGRGPDFLYIMSHSIDEDMWESILHDYYQRYKWHGRSPPNTESFQQLAEERCDCDLDILFTNWVNPQK